jgi:hypothetical protein
MSLNILELVGGVFSLVEDVPNDQELGEKIRKLMKDLDKPE